MSFAALRVYAAVLFFIALHFVSAKGWAQSDNKDNRPPQAGAFIGNLLPNGVDGVEEIIPLWGLRYSHGIGRNSYAEFAGIFGHSEGVDWQGGFVSLRLDIPVETLVATTYLGMDFTRYEGVGQKPRNLGGGHVGGGLMALIGGSTWARFDMKLNSKPGTSLYFALGLVFQLDGGGEQGP